MLARGRTATLAPTKGGSSGVGSVGEQTRPLDCSWWSERAEGGVCHVAKR